MKLNRLLIIIPAYNEGKNICQVVDDINKLGDTIMDYNAIVNGMHRNIQSNNKQFNNRLAEIVDDLFGKGKD